MSGYVDVPDGWTRVTASGPGPFVSSEVIREPDGTEHRWESRRHRKQSPARRRDAAKTPGSESVWWRPHQRDWWMAVLFVIGSLCFTAGAVASQGEATPRRWIGVTFFVGSLFFTSAAYVPAVLRGGQRRARARPPQASGSLAAGIVGAQADRLAGHARAADRHAPVQHQHVRRAEHEPDHASSQRARVGAGRVRLDRVPGRERARLRGGLPSLDQLQESHAVLEDRRAQHARLDCVRRVRELR